MFGYIYVERFPLSLKRYLLLHNWCLHPHRLQGRRLRRDRRPHDRVHRVRLDLVQSRVRLEVGLQLQGILHHRRHLVPLVVLEHRMRRRLARRRDEALPSVRPLKG